MDRIYANYVSTEGSAFDIAVDFGYQTGQADPEQLMRVVMSWEHAVVLVQVLQGQIARYENRIGEVPKVDPVPQAEETT